MSQELPSMPDYPSHNYLDYNALLSTSLNLLQNTRPRSFPQITLNGVNLQSIEDLDNSEPPYKFNVKFDKPLKPESELFKGMSATLDSRFTSEDGLDVISEHLTSPEVMEDSIIDFDYQSLMVGLEDFITQSIREWQTKGKAQKFKIGDPQTRILGRVSVTDTAKFTDESGDNDYFDPAKVEEKMTSNNPTINENDFDQLYADSPKHSPDGIVVMHVHGLIAKGTQYIFGYVYPHTVTTAPNHWDGNLYNDFEFNITNPYLAKIILAYFLSGVPEPDFTEQEYFED